MGLILYGCILFMVFVIICVLFLLLFVCMCVYVCVNKYEIYCFFEYLNLIFMFIYVLLY